MEELAVTGCSNPALPYMEHHLPAMTTALAEAGYRMQAQKIYPYELQ